MQIDGFILQLISGAKITICISILSILFGVLLGLLWAICALKKEMSILQNSIVIFNSIIRGMPEILIIFGMYFGGAVFINNILHLNISVNPFIVGVLGLALIYGAYAMQVFIGAILMIPHGQIDSGRALGLSPVFTFFHILLPQIFRYSLPGLSNLCLVTLKDSSLVALIGLQDLMFSAQVASNESFKPFTYYMLSALMYLILTSFFEIIFKIIYNKYRHGFK